MEVYSRLDKENILGNEKRVLDISISLSQKGMQQSSTQYQKTQCENLSRALHYKFAESSIGQGVIEYLGCDHITGRR